MSGAAVFGGGAMAGATILAERLTPWVYNQVKKAAGQTLTGATKRKFDQLLGMVSGQGPIKYRRTQYPRLPRFRKGYERVSGFSGRFKPTQFGKELKFFDTKVVALGTISQTWLRIAAINLVGRGTGPNQRNGRNFIIRSLQMRFKIRKNEGFDEDTVRIVVVLDRQTNGDNMTQQQLWQDTGDTNANWRSYRNLENISRFEILWDKTYTLNAYTAISGSEKITSLADTYYKKVNIKVEMSGTSGTATITDIKDNSIHVWACSERNPEFVQAINFRGTFRIRFTG